MTHFQLYVQLYNGLTITKPGNHPHSSTLYIVLHRLYLVLEERIEDCPSPILHSLGLCLLDFSVVNMALSPSALEGHLLKLTLRLEHPEYAVRHRALLVDRTLYEKQVEDSKVYTGGSGGVKAMWRMCLFQWLCCDGVPCRSK